MDIKTEIEQTINRDAKYLSAYHAWHQGLSNMMPKPGKNKDLPYAREQFEKCVRIIYSLYSKGAVESIDMLPKPEEVSRMNKEELFSLSAMLSERYIL